MASRVLWFTIGAAAGMVAARRLELTKGDSPVASVVLRTVDLATERGRRAAQSLGQSFGGRYDEFRRARAEREAELADALLGDDAEVDVAGRYHAWKSQRTD